MQKMKVRTDWRTQSGLCLQNCCALRGQWARREPERGREATPQFRRTPCYQWFRGGSVLVAAERPLSCSRRQSTPSKEVEALKPAPSRCRNLPRAAVAIVNTLFNARFKHQHIGVAPVAEVRRASAPDLRTPGAAVTEQWPHNRRLVRRSGQAGFLTGGQDLWKAAACILSRLATAARRASRHRRRERARGPAAPPTASPAGTSNCRPGRRSASPPFLAALCALQPQGGAGLAAAPGVAPPNQRG